MNKTASIEKLFYKKSPYDGFDIKDYKEDLTGWHSNEPVFKDLLEEVNPALFIEVGTWLGASAINIAKLLNEMNSDCPVLCVDTWLGSEEFYHDIENSDEYTQLNHQHGFPTLYFQFLANVILTGCQERILPIPQTSDIAARVFEYFKLSPDLVYLDGSHHQNDVWRDLQSYYSLLKPGGIIFGDDYDEHWPGLIQSVNEFSCSNNLNLDITGCFWILRKPVDEKGAHSKASSGIEWNGDLTDLQKLVVALQTENAVLRARMDSLEIQKEIVFGKKNKVIREMNLEKHHLIGLIHKQRRMLQEGQNNGDK